MGTPARDSLRRASAWAADQPALRAAIVFGSVATGRDTAESDLDLILVADEVAADALWQSRAEIAETILGAPVVVAQEPSWQGHRRYQAWTAEALQLDLTVADAVPTVFAGLAQGFLAVYDRAGIADQLTAAIRSWTPPEPDANALETSTWAWLRYLHGRLRRGELFAVRAGLFDTLMHRVAPLLGTSYHRAQADLAPDDLRRLDAAAPTSGDPAELVRALHATASLYDQAADRWSDRTGHQRRRCPLATLTLAQLRPSHSEPDADGPGG